MGIYAITGGTKGIGAAAVEALKNLGHDVINIDIDRGDINADLGTNDGRKKIIDELHARYPAGLDGLILNAGIAGAPKLSRVLSVNYFGSIAVAEGVFDLLKMKKGGCTITVSAGVALAPTRDKYYVDELLANCGDEPRICRLVDKFDPKTAQNAVYCSTKIALARWVKRISSSWAQYGITVNAVAPGAVSTTIMNDVGVFKNDNEVMGALPTPLTYQLQRMMVPEEVGTVLALMATPGARGCVGTIIFCDGGNTVLLRPDKVY